MFVQVKPSAQLIGRNMLEIKKAEDWQISYICSKYNDVSLKNILSLGLKFKHSVNDIDNFYG